MKQPNPEQASPQQHAAMAMVDPSPVPTIVGVSMAEMIEGGHLVLIQFSTPQGMQVFFLAPENAAKIGQDLKNMAEQAATGIVVPHKPSLVVPT